MKNENNNEKLGDYIKNIKVEDLKKELKSLFLVYIR